MDTINVAASFLNRLVDVLLLYLKENAFAIGILLAAIYYFRTLYPNGLSSQGYMLSSPQDASKAPKTAKKNHNDKEKMKQARQRQQEMADEHAKEGYRKRKEKDEKERNRKNHVAKDNSSGSNGDRLGDGESYRSGNETNGRHPLEPSTSNTQSYRPTRRNPRA